MQGGPRGSPVGLTYLSSPLAMTWFCVMTGSPADVGHFMTWKTRVNAMFGTCGLSDVL